MIEYTNTDAAIDEEIALSQESGDEVFIDDSNENTETDFPSGLKSNPVSTFAVALVILAARFAKKIIVDLVDSFAVDVNFTLKCIIEGRMPLLNIFGLDLNGKTFQPGTVFKNLYIAGSCASRPLLQFINCFIGCHLYMGDESIIEDCAIDFIFIGDGFKINKCRPKGAGPIYLDGEGGAHSGGVLSNCSGDVVFQYYNGEMEHVLIANQKGRVYIQATVTNTSFIIVGACEVIDNGGTGVVIEFVPFSADLDPADVWSAATRSLTEPVDLQEATQDQIDAIETALEDGVRDLTDDEVKQLRDAIGITGTKVAATGGQLQGKLSEIDFTDYQNRTVVTRQAGNPKTYKMGTGANEKVVTVDYVDIGGGDLRADKETVA